MLDQAGILTQQRQMRRGQRPFFIRNFGRIKVAWNTHVCSSKHQAGPNLQQYLGELPVRIIDSHIRCMIGAPRWIDHLRECFTSEFDTLRTICSW